MPAMSSLAPAESFDRALMATLVGNDLVRTGASGAVTAAQFAGGASGTETVEVATLRLSEIISQFNLAPVSLIKIDVQHGELDVLAGLGPHDWRQVERLVIEVQDHNGQLARVTSFLTSHGFATTVHRDNLLHAGSPVAFVYAWAAGLHKAGQGPS
jgi:hypothetical protein